MPRPPLRLETLEDRLTPASGSTAFAHFGNLTVGPREPAAVLVHVRADDFTMPGGQVILGFAVQATDPHGADPGLVAVVPKRGTSARTLLRKADTAVGSASLTLARVGPGRVT